MISEAKPHEKIMLPQVMKGILSFFLSLSLLISLMLPYLEKIRKRETKKTMMPKYKVSGLNLSPKILRK